MIEGVRLLPWLKAAARDSKEGIAHLRDCERCMRERSVMSRQEIGCAYEPPSKYAVPWRHAGYNGPPPTVCPGYTTRLPEVLEVDFAYWHSGRSSWRDFVGAKASDHLMRCMEMIANESNAVDSYYLKPKKDG